LTMYDMEGIEMDEICNILSISSSNLRVLLHRARTTIHHKIEQYQQSDKQ
jgi:RNA polymerase sigma-70 factor (ECF subfamily)